MQIAFFFFFILDHKQRNGGIQFDNFFTILFSNADVWWWCIAVSVLDVRYIFLLIDPLVLMVIVYILMFSMTIFLPITIHFALLISGGGA